MRSQRLILKLPNYTKVTIITNINHSLNKEQFLEKLIAVKTHMKDFRLQGQAEKWSKQMSDIPRQMEKFQQPAWTPEEIAKFDKSKKAKYDENLAKKYKNAVKQLKLVIQKMLDTFRSFRNEHICHIWDYIIQTKIITTPWFNLRAKEEADELDYSLEAFEMIWMF